MEIQLITFAEIYEIWNNELWPGRESPIKEMSSMTFMGDYDMSVYERYRGTFWGVFIDDKLVGVNSGHPVSDTMYRSRGLWVHPEYRGRGIAKVLLRALSDFARVCEFEYVFTVPRKGSEHAYLTEDYKLVGDWFDHGMEFGPNIWAIKKL